MAGKDSINPTPETGAQSTEDLRALARLGTLAAGLVHDLNNPATGLAHAAGQLPEAVNRLQQYARVLGSFDLSEREEAALDRLADEFIERANTVRQLTPLEQSDVELAIQAWLDAAGVTESWKHAPMLVDAGWTAGQLDEELGAFAPEHLGTVLRWLSYGCLVHQLVSEIATSGQAISEISTSVRAQVRGARDEIEPAVLIDSLEHSLVVLRHKLSRIDVTRDFADLAPDVAVPGEFNQVWTNLIDNAIDAMNREGRLTLRAQQQPGQVSVEIEDSGSGIPDGLQDCIFDAFVTSKPAGKGTGLGLHISREIARRHGGDITVDSGPGKTVFTVQIPLDDNAGAHDG